MQLKDSNNLKIQKERPSSGQWITIWEHENKLWCETTVKIEGNYYCYNDETDEFDGLSVLSCQDSPDVNDSIELLGYVQ